jgi:hypothetical protein
MIKTKWIVQVAFLTFAQELATRGKTAKFFNKGEHAECRRYAKIIVPATTECGG